MEVKDHLKIEELRNGNEKIFNSIFDDYYIPLCLFSNKYIDDLDKSRSIVQEVFVTLWIKKAQLKVTQSLKSYLYTAVKNTTLDYLKHLKVESKYISELRDSSFSDQNIQDQIEENEVNQKINRAIENLPEQSKLVFKLSKIEGLKYAEIASRLNISKKTVEMHMGNALKKLRLQLSENLLLLWILLKKDKKNIF